MHCVTFQLFNFKSCVSYSQANMRLANAEISAFITVLPLNGVLYHFDATTTDHRGTAIVYAVWRVNMICILQL